MSDLQLEHLPSEILLKIFSILPSKDIISCIQVNRRFNRIIERSRKSLAKSNANLWIDFSKKKNIFSISLSSNTREYLQIKANCGEMEENDKLETQLAEYLATYHTKTTKTEISTSKTLQSALHILLTFILHRCQLAHLHLGPMSTLELNLLYNLLIDAKCRPLCIRMTFNNELTEGADQMLRLAENGINLFNVRLDEEFFERDYLRKCKQMGITLNKNSRPFYIGKFIRNYSAAEINLKRPFYIRKEDVLHIIEEWFAGKKELKFHKFSFFDESYSFTFLDALSFQSIPEHSKLGTMFTRPQDGQNLFFKFFYNGAIHPWLHIEIMTGNYSDFLSEDED